MNLDDALYATWPAFRTAEAGGFTIREGRDGGRRVSAATALPAWSEANIEIAEAAMDALGQPRLFRIRPGEDALDAHLAARGYLKADASVLYAAPVAALGPDPGPMAAFAHWPPLAVTRRIWDEGGTGAPRQAVMDRAPDPRTALLARSADHPAGAAFVALHGSVAMLHAVFVPPDRRRTGTGRNLVRRAAVWAAGHGATDLALAVTETNGPACALYASLGMVPVGQYHYRTT